MFVHIWKISIYRKEENILFSWMTHNLTPHSLDPSHTQTMPLSPITPGQPCLLSGKHSVDYLIIAAWLSHFHLWNIWVKWLREEELISVGGFRAHMVTCTVIFEPHGRRCVAEQSCLSGGSWGAGRREDDRGWGQDISFWYTPTKNLLPLTRTQMLHILQISLHHQIMNLPMMTSESLFSN